MIEKDVRHEMKNGRISSRYLLIGDEPLLIERTVATIKESLGVHDEFDVESYSASEIELDEVVPRFYTSSMLSSRRLFLIKNLEDLEESGLRDLQVAIGRGSLPNCLVLTYRLDKKDVDNRRKIDRITEIFPDTTFVTYQPEKHQVRDWIASRNRRSKLNLTPEMTEYLEEEFDNDVTGLKNEMEKIENFLFEQKSLTTAGIRDLAIGLGEFETMRFATAFINEDRSALQKFEDCRSYVDKYEKVVSDLGWRLVKNAPRFRDRKMVQAVLDRLLAMDRKVKTSSQFVDVHVELLLERKWDLFGKGVGYGQ